jgi:hypothetical protein
MVFGLPLRPQETVKHVTAIAAAVSRTGNFLTMTITERTQFYGSEKYTST